MAIGVFRGNSLRFFAQRVPTEFAAEKRRRRGAGKAGEDARAWACATWRRWRAGPESLAPAPNDGACAASSRKSHTKPIESIFVGGNLFETYFGTGLSHESLFNMLVPVRCLAS